MPCGSEGERPHHVLCCWSAIAVGGIYSCRELLCSSGSHSSVNANSGSQEWRRGSSGWSPAYKDLPGAALKRHWRDLPATSYLLTYHSLTANERTCSLARLYGQCYWKREALWTRSDVIMQQRGYWLYSISFVLCFCVHADFWCSACYKMFRPKDALQDALPCRLRRQ